jgi:hypothetical protein
MAALSAERYLSEKGLVREVRAPVAEHAPAKPRWVLRRCSAAPPSRGQPPPHASHVDLAQSCLCVHARCAAAAPPPRSRW